MESNVYCFFLLRIWNVVRIRTVVLCCWQSGFVLIQKSALTRRGHIARMARRIAHKLSNLELLEANKLIYLGLQF